MTSTDAAGATTSGLTPSETNISPATTSTATKKAKKYRQGSDK